MLLLVLTLQAAPALIPIPKSGLEALAPVPAARTCVGCDTRSVHTFRVTLDPDAKYDGKSAALRGLAPACGTTGMPVCPKSGREVWRLGF